MIKRNNIEEKNNNFAKLTRWNVKNEGIYSSIKTMAWYVRDKFSTMFCDETYLEFGKVDPNLINAIISLEK